MLPRASFCLVLVALATLAYAPLVDTAFLGADLATLVDVARIAWPGEGGLQLADLFRVRGLEDAPLSALVLSFACRLLTLDGLWVGAEALVLRLVNLMLLFVSAWGLTRFVRRALLPWTGTDGARSGGYASALILALHPLCVSVVAAPAGIGDLLGLGFAVTAAATFLTGRQERRHGLVVGAVLCAILCGLASEIAYFLALVVALTEFTSARRHRPRAVRLRTAGTTLIVFGAAASVEFALSAACGVTPPLPRLVAVWLPSAGGASFAQGLAVAVEKLGLLIMPVHPFGGLGTLGFVVGGAALLAALEPALVATRSAPRLWGWLVGTWCGAIGAVMLSTAAVRVPPDTFAHAETLFPAAVVMAVGLGIASTALSGARRWMVPALVGAGYALLAHAATEPYRPAGEALGELRADLDRARERHGRHAMFLVVDPPERVAGLDVLGGWLDLVLHPSFTGEPEEVVVRGLTLEALFLYARQPEFDALRGEQPLVLVYPAAALEGLRGADAPAPTEGRLSARIAPPAAHQEPIVWREPRSPSLELDPLHHAAVRATARVGVDPGALELPPRVAWRARGELVANAALDGVWMAGPDGPRAFFDVERSLAWLVGDEIARVWFEGALAEPVSAEVLAQIPRLELARRTRDGTDWLFEIDPDEQPRPLAGDGTWRLELLDLTRLEALTLDVEPDLDGPQQGGRDEDGAQRTLRVRDAALWEDRVLERGGGPIAWSLAFAVGPTTLARRDGRITE